MFSTIAHAAFPGNTSDFLLVLAIGTALPMALGWFFVRPIPLPTLNGVNDFENRLPSSPDTSSPWRSYLERGDDSGTRLLPDDELDHEENHVRSQKRHARAVSIASCGEVITDALADDNLPDISGKELLVTLDFWLLFTIMSLCESPDTPQRRSMLTHSSEWRRSDV